MSEQRFGPRRCRDSRKLPLDQCVQVNFYRCPVCGAVFHETGLDLTVKELSCCGRKTGFLNAIDPEQARVINPNITIEYKIVGGYNDNAIQFYWNQTDAAARPVWIYLKTFTGGYIKYLPKTKRAPLVFAMADMDAFSYCDEDPCLECTFRCKRGFEIYAFIEQVGLVGVPLDKMSPYWETR